jgi:hypothetical protein
MWNATDLFQVDFRKAAHVEHDRAKVLAAEIRDDETDDEFFDAMVNVFGEDNRPVQRGK